MKVRKGKHARNKLSLCIVCGYKNKSKESLLPSNSHFTQLPKNAHESAKKMHHSR